ncbi:PTS sugar transporter subunit IIA [Geobacillus sp. 44B]|uniref:PTS system, galactitol-specific IIA component n=1 Tax=Saccharococcus caldoxylosilyticus TaxID=81408 RepID=A0A150KX20_9BACL|nr:PTS sugar transporter subunit IIA [Parageobacillus caldoxylosilyticus]KYD04369.1 PTS system, galactitol-specific IIA component [Parageobacillus caldoxylosilyticus]QNU37562.1 PTS sugar transporter subunit IIA [Geobacillus sp. 44B]
MCEIYFDESLILKDVNVNNREELLKIMAINLFEKGLVKESFIEAVIEREKNSATGLPTNGVSVAIPHTDSEHVNKNAISVAILKEPVKFGVMGERSAETPVQIVFMLAINKEDSHLVLLQKLMGIFQNKEELQFLMSEENRTNIKNRLANNLQIL